MSCSKVKNPPGFAPCRVAKSKTRRVSRHVVWQSPKPAGFRAMSSDKVQNPPSFAPCRVTKSKTRRVSRHVVWQSPKPAGFRAMSCDKAQNPPNFACTRVGAYCIRPQKPLDRGLRLKPAKFCTYPCRGAKAYAPKRSCAEGLDVKSGRFWVYSYRGGRNRVRFWRIRMRKCETRQILHVLV